MQKYVYFIICITSCAQFITLQAQEEKRQVVPLGRTWATFEEYNQQFLSQQPGQEQFNTACQKLKEKKYAESLQLFQESSKKGNQYADYVLGYELLTKQLPPVHTNTRAQMPKVFLRLCNHTEDFPVVKRCVDYLYWNRYAPAQRLLSLVYAWTGHAESSAVMWQAARMQRLVYVQSDNVTYPLIYLDGQTYEDEYWAHLRNGNPTAAFPMLSFLPQLNEKLAQEIPKFTITPYKYSMLENLALNVGQQTNEKKSPVETPVESKQHAVVQQLPDKPVAQAKQDLFEQLLQLNDYEPVHAFIEEIKKENLEKAADYLSQFDKRKDFSHSLKKNIHYFRLLDQLFMEVGDNNKANSYLIQAVNLGDLDSAVTFYARKGADPFVWNELWKKAIADNASDEQKEDIAKQIVNADYAKHEIAPNVLGDMIASYLQAACCTKTPITSKSFPFNLTGKKTKKLLHGQSALMQSIEQAIQAQILDEQTLSNLYQVTGQAEKVFNATLAQFKNGVVLDKQVMHEFDLNQLMQIMQVRLGKTDVDEQTDLVIKNRLINLLNKDDGKTIISDPNNIIYNFVGRNKNDEQLFLAYIKVQYKHAQKQDEKSWEQLFKGVPDPAIGNIIQAYLDNKKLITFCLDYMSDEHFAYLYKNYKQFFEEKNNSCFSKHNNVQLYCLSQLRREQKYQQFLEKSAVLKQDKRCSDVVSDFQKEQLEALDAIGTWEGTFSAYALLLQKNDSIWIDHLKKMGTEYQSTFIKECVELLGTHAQISTFFGNLNIKKKDQYEAFDQLIYILSNAVARGGEYNISADSFGKAVVSLFDQLAQKWGTQWDTLFKTSSSKDNVYRVAAWVLQYGKYDAHEQTMEKAYQLLTGSTQYYKERNIHVQHVGNGKDAARGMQLLQEEVKQGNYFSQVDALAVQEKDKQFVGAKCILEAINGLMSHIVSTDKTTLVAQDDTLYARLLMIYIIKQSIVCSGKDMRVTVDTVTELIRHFEQEIITKEEQDGKALTKERNILALLKGDTKALQMSEANMQGAGFNDFLAFAIYATKDTVRFNKNVDAKQVGLLHSLLNTNRILNNMGNIGLTDFEVQCLSTISSVAIASLYEIVARFEELVKKEEVGLKLLEMTEHFTQSINSNVPQKGIDYTITMIRNVQNIYQKHSSLFKEAEFAPKLADLINETMSAIHTFDAESAVRWKQKLCAAGCTTLDPHTYDIVNSEQRSNVLLNNIDSIRAYLELYAANQALAKVNPTLPLQRLSENFSCLWKVEEQDDAYLAGVVDKVGNFLYKNFPQSEVGPNVIFNYYAVFKKDRITAKSVLEPFAKKWNQYAQVLIERLDQETDASQAKNRAPAIVGQEQLQKIIAKAKEQNNRVLTKFVKALKCINNGEFVQGLLTEYDNDRVNAIVTNLFEYVKDQSYDEPTCFEWNMWSSIGLTNICVPIEQLGGLSTMPAGTKSAINLLLCFCYVRLYQLVKPMAEDAFRTRGLQDEKTNHMFKFLNTLSAKFQIASQGVVASAHDIYTVQFLNILMSFHKNQKDETQVKKLVEACNNITQKDRRSYDELYKKSYYIAGGVLALMNKGSHYSNKTPEYLVDQLKSLGFNIKVVDPHKYSDKK